MMNFKITCDFSMGKKTYIVRGDVGDTEGWFVVPIDVRGRIHLPFGTIDLPDGGKRNFAVNEIEIDPESGPKMHFRVV